MKTITVLVVGLGGIAGLTACGSGDDSGASADGAYVTATAATHSHDAPTPSQLTEAPIAVELLEQALAYGETSNRNLIGYLAMPADAVEPLPGIVVIHEWWGLNDNIKAMTRRLAAEGFVVLAVDLYGGASAMTPAEAQALMAAVMENPEAALSNLHQAHDYLAKYAFAPKVAVLGWCLGGAWALRAALEFPTELDAMVMYYGQIVSEPELLAVLDLPILGLFAENDDSIPVRAVQDFRSRLRELGKPADIYIYSDVGHAFANPSGGTYDAEAAENAWERTIAFLKSNL